MQPKSLLDQWGLPAHPQRGLMAAFALLTMAAIGAATALDTWWMAGIPVVGLVVWVAVADFKILYFLMLACIPISTEVELPGGLATDLFSEPLMWLLTLAGVLWLLRNGSTLDGRFLRHPITLMLLVHLTWMLITAVFSQNLLVSFKFLLAKGWYVVVFYFLAARVLQTERDLKKMVWWFFLPLVFTAITILYRHSFKGFTFESINSVLSPFYRNHVMYACILAAFVPFLWFASFWYKFLSKRWWIIIAGIIILLIGINFAYTRAAYAALVAAIVVNILVRLKAVKFGLLVATLLLGVFIAFVTYRDNWLLFAPDYERTITHVRFESLLEATTRLEDISVMERVYRWVAASRMIEERPVLGFGPGNFYNYYKDYTVSSFKTYVSANPERSGMHNYYLMTAVEQGLPGTLIFIGLCFFAMIQGQRIYHQMTVRWRKHILLSALLSFVLIVILMLMNDFVETDKIGSLFFINLALIVNMDLDKSKA